MRSLENAALQRPESPLEKKRNFKIIEGGSPVSEGEKKKKSILERDRKLNLLMETHVAHTEKENLSERIETMEILEAFETGEEIARKGLNTEAEAGLAAAEQKTSTKKEKAGVNQVFRCEYKNAHNEAVIGYAKSARGESAIDAEGFEMVWNDSEKKYVRKPDNAHAGALGRAIAKWSTPEFFEGYCQEMIKQYAVPTEEAEAFKQKLKPELFGSRLDIEPGQSVVREKVVYAFDRAFRFNTIMPTALRIEKDETGKMVDVASVQEQVKNKDSSHPVRQCGLHELRTFLFAPEDTWAEALNIPPEWVPKIKRSLIIGACMQWANGALDSHHENMFITDEGIKYIDNGLSFGKARGIKVYDGEKTVRDSETKKMKKVKADSTEIFRQMRSVPMEILKGKKDWALSEADRDEIERVYQEILQDGPTTRAFEEGFKMMFEDKRIAQKQMTEYIKSMQHLIKHGRPPDNAEIYPIGMAASMQG